MNFPPFLYSQSSIIAWVNIFALVTSSSITANCRLRAYCCRSRALCIRSPHRSSVDERKSRRLWRCSIPCFRCRVRSISTVSGRTVIRPIHDAVIHVAVFRCILCSANLFLITSDSSSSGTERCSAIEGSAKPEPSYSSMFRLIVRSPDSSSLMATPADLPSQSPWGKIALRARSFRYPRSLERDRGYKFKYRRQCVIAFPGVAA